MTHSTFRDIRLSSVEAQAQGGEGTRTANLRVILSFENLRRIEG